MVHASEEEKREELTGIRSGWDSKQNHLEAFSPFEKLLFGLEWEVADNSDGGRVGFGVSWAWYVFLHCLNETQLILCSVWCVKDPRVSMLFPVVHYWYFLLSPEEEPLSLMSMKTPCCWCGISESLSSRIDFFNVLHNPVRVFPRSAFRMKSGPGFPPSLLPALILKISLRGEE